MVRPLFSCLLLAIFFLSACTNQDTEEGLSGDDHSSQIIDQAIQSMGGKILDGAQITFDFRDQSLSYYNDHGEYRYTRVFPDTAGQIITDTLTNHHFVRYQDGKKLNLSAERIAALQGGVNSIVYFAFLPYKLNDPGVIKEYVGQVTIDDKPYEKVRISFHTPPGEVVHSDVYLYYFDSEDYSLDYLAYEFEENDGGIRFRSGYNVRNINGLLVQDYINYMADPDSVDFSMIETYYNNNQLKELSRVELKNIKVQPLP